MEGNAADGGQEDFSDADIGPSRRQMSTDISAATLLSIPHHVGSVAAQLMNSAVNERGWGSAWVWGGALHLADSERTAARGSANKIYSELLFNTAAAECAGS